MEIDVMGGATEYRRIADVDSGWFGGDFGDREPREVYLETVGKLKTKADVKSVVSLPLRSELEF